jgi:murein DD-endopeptidase MepM/ murein hydrolase activator NlpD
MRAGVVMAIILSLSAAVACGGGSGAENATRTGSAAPSPTIASVTATPAPTPPAPVNLDYTVQEGDTLSAIAERFGVSPQVIIDANAPLDEASLTIGQILHIPGVDPAIAGVAPVASPSSESPIGMRFIMPLAGACMPRDEGQMPNAPREYRNGFHEGLDFFTGFACIDVPLGLPVLAPADGTVIRADHEYKQLTATQLQYLLDLTATQGYSDSGTLDKFRGRQLWVDHGNGIVTRYAHLSDIPSEVQVGTKVQQGQGIAFVGDSGTPEALDAPGYNKHLHFEIRVGDSFLGAGLPPDEVRAQYESVFGLR